MKLNIKIFIKFCRVGDCGKFTAFSTLGRNKVFDELFGEYSTFFKAFRAKYGRSPREYQNEIRKK